MSRSIKEICAEIRKDWRNIHYTALPYLEAMESSSYDESRDSFGADKGVIFYFLSNAATWRGPVARRIKAELKARIKR